jgi:hypothetical protein
MMDNPRKMDPVTEQQTPAIVTKPNDKKDVKTNERKQHRPQSPKPEEVVKSKEKDQKK